MFRIIRDVINSGSCFEIQSNFEDSFDGLELFDEAEDFDDETKDKFKNPWTQKFDELKLSMRMVSQYIYKRVEKAGIGERTVPKRASVRVDYNGYFENDDQPYDSTLLRGTPETHRVCNGAMSVGLSEAIMTMKVGEEAWFW